MLYFASTNGLIFPKVTQSQSLASANTVYTDGSRNLTVAYHSSPGSKNKMHTSGEWAELFAVFMVLEDFAFSPINIYSDGPYVVRVMPALETAYICWTHNQQWCHLFHRTQELLNHHQSSRYIGHINLHSGLPDHWLTLIHKTIPWLWGLYSASLPLCSPP